MLPLGAEGVRVLQPEVESSTSIVPVPMPRCSTRGPGCLGEESRIHPNNGDGENSKGSVCVCLCTRMQHLFSQ